MYINEKHFSIRPTDSEDLKDFEAGRNQARDTWERIKRFVLALEPVPTEI